MSKLHPALLLLVTALPGLGQQSITQVRVPETQNFDSLGASASATLPTGWRRDVEWNSLEFVLTQAAGTTGAGVIASGSNGGAYNWGNGVTASATDRAPGFLSSGGLLGWSSPCYLWHAITNNTGTTLRALDLSWAYEKYRSGTRAFTWTFEHGATVTSLTAVADGAQSYAADANNTTVFNPPASVAKSFRISGLSIAPGATYYLRWTYTGTGGSTNAQGLGLDDFSVTPIAPVITQPSVLVAFNTEAGSPSAVQSLTVAAADLLEDVSVTAPAGFEVSADAVNYGPGLVLGASSLPATVSVRLAASSTVGAVSGGLTLATLGADTRTVALSGTVIPLVVTGSSSLNGFTAPAGDSSPSQSLTISGVGVSAPLDLTAPEGFEISTNGSTYSKSLQVGTRVVSIASNGAAFAALKSDGSVVTWGVPGSGGNSSAVADRLTAGVTKIYSTIGAFAALKDDGSVVTWGGGGGDSSAVAERLRSGVVSIFSTSEAFAALKGDGSVVTWGLGDAADSSAVAGQLTSGVTRVFSTDQAFAALKSDGSVVTWGNAVFGGNSSIATLTYDPDLDDEYYVFTSVAPSLLSGVTEIYSSRNAFAALKSDGSLVTWGMGEYGGDSSSVASKLTANVAAVYSTYATFAALKTDGSVVTWGFSYQGTGTSPSAGVDSKLTTGVVRIYTSPHAFAALKENGSVVTWGHADYGGNSTSVASSLSAGVTAIYSNNDAFAALKNDGSVVTWGFPVNGGDSSAVASSLSEGVTAIFSTGAAFAALKNNGSVFTWGNAPKGGDSSSVASLLSAGVTAIYPNPYAFAALKNNGSVVTWGAENLGGLSSSVAGLLAPAPLDMPFTLHVRLAASSSAGSVSGNLSVSTAGAATKTVSLSGTVNAWLQVSSSTLSGFIAEAGSPSSTQSFNITGAGITQPVVLTAPAGYEISHGGGGFGSVLELAADSLPASISTRLAATSSRGPVSGNLTISSDGATAKSIALSGTVTAWFLPSASSLTGLSSNSGSASTAQTLTVSGAGLSGPLTVTVPAGFEVSLDGVTYATSVSAASSLPATLHVRLAANAPVGAVTGNLTLSSAGVSSKTIALAGTIHAWLEPSSTALSGFTANEGGTSASQTISVSSAGLDRSLVVTAPAGFEISSDGRAFASSLRLGNSLVSITSSAFAFAGLKSDGSVITWGDSQHGGDSSAVASQLAAGVSEIHSNPWAFAAVKNSGAVVTWGLPTQGGDSSSVATQLQSGVTMFCSTVTAFAAVKNDGSVVTWGSPDDGGDSTSVGSQLSAGVTSIHSNTGAFAALKSDGSVVTWGRSLYGGDSSSVAGMLTSGVAAIYSSAGGSAFAALKNDGSVVAWGRPDKGGSIPQAVSSQLASGVTEIYSNDHAFAALKSDGSVVCWGYSSFGGTIPETLATELHSGVLKIDSTGTAFAALKEGGKVVTWGSQTFGGDSSAVSADLASGVVKIYSSRHTFAALKGNGSVVTWGEPSEGGDSAAVAGRLASGVTTIKSTSVAFAALKTDGSVVTWGDPYSGGNSAAVSSHLSSGVTELYSNYDAFAALKNDGTLVTWGDSSAGGDSSSVAAQLLPSAPQFPVTIHVRLAASAPAGAVSGNLTLTSSGATSQSVSLSGTVTAAPAHTHQELWRFANFGSHASENSGADNADPDGDGLSNLMEYALGQNPNTSGILPASLALNGANLEYTYTRSTTAKDNGVTYQIEWSDTLEAGSWSTQQVAEQIQGTEGSLETVKASLPRGGGGKRFLRLQVTGPAIDQ